jgi:uncharacterized protein YkwD
MRRLSSLPATTLTILVVAAVGSLPAAASARVHVRRGSTAEHRSRTVGHAHRTLQVPVQPRHRTRGFRGRSPAARAPRQAAVAGRASAIAAALAVSCQNTELTPTPANLEAVRAAVLCLVNRERAQNGDAPLILNPQLTQAAEGHGHEMVADDYFQHVSPSGLSPVDRIRGTGYIPGTNVGYVIGENLAWGTLGLATPQAIVAAWIASPGHLANILETQYTETGLGITPQVPPSLSEGSAGATYTQEFGVIIH